MIETLPLFRPLNQKLITLLNGLTVTDWGRRTVAKQWTVKDVAAHLLDGNIRNISMYRDDFWEEPDAPISSYADLVQHLNRLNGDWVRAMKRLSPALLIEWLESTHEGYISSLEKLDLLAPAKFSVAWAGEEVSPNWFHIAREFTEKWHHQQQIWDAVNQAGILTKEFYPSVLDTFMRALPFRYRGVKAAAGTTLHILIDSDAGGEWFLTKQDSGWDLSRKPSLHITTKIVIPADLSWRLLTSAVRYEHVKNSVRIEGDAKLALPVLQTVSVMA
jgi:uncharacterized protein (TIGR03083 family)